MSADTERLRRKRNVSWFWFHTDCPSFPFAATPLGALTLMSTPFVLLTLLAVILCALFAWQKKRNPLLYGLLGAVFYTFGPLFILFSAHLCPRCKTPLRHRDWEQGRCTRCGKPVEERTRVFGRCITSGAVAAAVGSIPLAGIAGFFLRFPVPFQETGTVGAGAIVPAMFTAVFYSLLGGALVQAALGSVAGSLAYAFVPRSAGPVHPLAVAFGVACALPGVLLIPLGPWG